MTTVKEGFPDELIVHVGDRGFDVYVRVWVFPQQRACLVFGEDVLLSLVDNTRMLEAIATAIRPRFPSDVRVEWSEDTWTVQDGQRSRIVRVSTQS